MDVNKDTMVVKLINPLKCPVRVYVCSWDTAIYRYFKDKNPILVPPRCGNFFQIISKGFKNRALNTYGLLGDPKNEIKHDYYSLPIPKGKEVYISQGYYGKFTHNDDFSKFAIDFPLNENDTVYSASDGFVVEMTDKFKHGGKNRKWIDYANRLMIYNTKSGLFFDYVHLAYKGCFVNVGDKIIRGQAIGLAGSTGLSTGIHLHFNVLKPVVDSGRGLKSVSCDFIEGYKGYDLVKGSKVIRKSS